MVRMTRPCDAGCEFGPDDIESWTDEEVLLIFGPRVLELRQRKRSTSAGNKEGT